MELALDDCAEDPEAIQTMEPSDMYEEAQLKAELALTLGIICAHSVQCRDHLAEELSRLPMWAKSIRHRLLSALQDISPNSFSDLMIYDEENVLLNSTLDWDGSSPKARAASMLDEQRARCEAREQARLAGDELPPPDSPDREADANGPAWSMVGTQAALALTQELLRQALEGALKCAPREPPKLLSDEQKAEMFAKINEAMEACGGRLLETFRRFDKDRNGFVEVSELARMLESMGLVFSNSEKKGVVQLFDLNKDNQITYKEFLRVVYDNTGNSRGAGGLHRRDASVNPPSPTASSVAQSSTSGYQQYLAGLSARSNQLVSASSRKDAKVLSTVGSQSALRSATNARSARSSQVVDAHADDPETRLTFSLDFVDVSEAVVAQKVKMAKRHCVQVRKELVILPANHRPRRAALLAASSKAEKFRGAWETLHQLIRTQGETMVRETLAAMRATVLTDLNLVSYVNELSNRFPLPDETYVDNNNVGSGANSLGPLGLTGSPTQNQSPTQGYDYADDTDSTDSEDDLGDLQLLGIASH
jgi:hypothetical protein